MVREGSLRWLYIDLWAWAKVGTQERKKVANPGRKGVPVWFVEVAENQALPLRQCLFQWARGRILGR